MKKKYTHIDTYKANYEEDKLELYDYTAQNGTYRIVITTVGAYDENGEETTGMCGRVEVIADYEEHNYIIDAIYKHFEECGDYELYLDTTTDYNSFINTRNYVEITTWGSPDDVETITDTIANILDVLG